VKVTTFYSFKGGLGRTLLLAWTARALVAKGKKVVALDLDLEAPGLHYKLGVASDADLGAGVVGLITSFQRGDPPPADLRTWLRPVPGTDLLQLFPAGSSCFGDYCRSLADVSWEDLFFGPNPQGVRFFTWLREAIERDVGPDHLLIDARTGITEMGGAALGLLADQVLALVGTSPEGVDGTRDVLRSVVAMPRGGRAAPRIGVVLSRIPGSLDADDLQRIRRTIRDHVSEEATPLTATVAVELPLVVRSEPGLQVNELAALDSDDLRLHSDYRTVLDWVLGEAVPTSAPGDMLATSASHESIRDVVALQRRLLGKQAERYLPEVANSLSSLGAKLSELGRREDALAAAEEAVAITTELTAQRPHLHAPTLQWRAQTLRTLLEQSGRASDSSSPLTAALALLAELGPPRTEPDPTSRGG